jgi:hypothetical protein
VNRASTGVPRRQEGGHPHLLVHQQGEEVPEYCISGSIKQLYVIDNNEIVLLTSMYVLLSHSIQNQGCSEMPYNKHNINKFAYFSCACLT